MRRRKVKICHSEWRGRWEEGEKMRKGGGREENQIARVKVRGKMQKDKVIVIQ